MKNPILLLLLLVSCQAAMCQTLVQSNPLKEVLHGKVQRVKSTSYESSGDSLNPKKEGIKNEERLLHERAYDLKGFLTEIRYLNPENKLKYRTVFTRDKKGLITQEENIVSTGKKTKSIARSYDKKGMML
ncbi:MAG: hypothetical protein ACHQF2_12110, partial [Flavobacteriales bacterium]